MKKQFDYATNFCEFLNGNYYKFAAIISKNQYAIGMDTSLTHEGMLVDLIKKTRPNMEIDGFGNAIDKNSSYTHDTIVLMGEPGYIQIQLPDRDRLSKNQFDCLSEILYYVKAYNYECSNNNRSGLKYEIIAFGNDDIDIEAKDYSDNIEELLASLSKYVTPYVTLPQEAIIGRKFDVQVLSNSEKVDFMIQQMANNNIDQNGNPILGKNSEYRIKGYSTVFLLLFFSMLSSITIFIFGILMLMD